MVENHPAAAHCLPFPTPTLAEDILNTIETLVFVLNGNADVVYVSPAVQRILGYTPEEVLGDGWWDLAYSRDPDFGRYTRERLAITARGEIPVMDEAHAAQVYSASGQEHWIVWRDAKGPGDLIIGVGQDITQLHKAEQLILQHEHEFGAVFQNASDGMLILNRDWVYEQVNDAACQIFGTSREDLVGKEHGSILASTIDIVRFRERGLELGSYMTEAEFAAKDGEIRTIEVSVTTNFRPEHHLLILRDMTERKRMQSQLSQAHRLEAVGRLAGGVAHDFNNMLTAIQGFTELLQRKATSPKYQPYLKGILGATRRAAQTTQQLLAFSRKQMLQPRLLDLSQAVTDTMKLVQRVIGEDIDLSLMLAPEPLKVMVDPGQFSQILMNLAVNARDAMPDGGKLLIETRLMELDDEYVLRHVQVQPGRYGMMAVGDTGVGMPPEVLAHIFEPFFTTKPQGKGTGLGLATVYGIVKQSGGYVWVYSEPGQGTSFKVYLPLVDNGLQPQVQSKKEIVLVIEDDDVTRNIAVQALEEDGYRVLAARDGTDALAICQQRTEKIDVVLTDVMAGGMSGEDLMGYFAVKYPKVVVVHMSGFSRLRLEQANTIFPDALFLAKPFTVSQLLAMIRQALQRRAGALSDSLQE